ncbi:uncharacterized protein LOC141579018 [Camelus bactrianus]|uniref:Uncharacterized protein LOC141579018 n=2 Tax=Camelus bactrianus TaxID=9837 RepID=A0AC58R3Z6_CAMBA
MGPGGGHRPRPGQIRGLDSGVGFGAAAAAGRQRGGCRGRNMGPECAPRCRRRWARQAPLGLARRPLLGDVRVGGSGGGGGGGGGPATASAAAPTAAAFAGGRADAQGGGAPSAKRFGACGLLVAAAATAADGISGEGAASDEQPLGLLAEAKGVLGGGRLSVPRAGGRAGGGAAREIRAWGGGVDGRAQGQGGQARSPLILQAGVAASGCCGHGHDLRVGWCSA